MLSSSLLFLLCFEQFYSMKRYLGILTKVISRMLIWMDSFEKLAIFISNCIIFLILSYIKCCYFASTIYLVLHLAVAFGYIRSQLQFNSCSTFQGYGWFKLMSKKDHQDINHVNEKSMFARYLQQSKHFADLTNHCTQEEERYLVNSFVVVVCLLSWFSIVCFAEI